MTVDDRERLESLFQDHLDVGLHHGAQLAVYHEGDLVVDLVGGTAGPDRGALERDQRMVLFSSTKPLTGACIHRLADAGALDYDDRIVDHWPGFAEAGTPKADVTVRHVLSHQGGFPSGPFDTAFEDWTDWDAVVEAMEAADLDWEPGTDAAYHPMSYGWVLGEVVRKVSGQPVDAYARAHVFDPLGMSETYMGLPEEVEDDVATLVGFNEFDRCRTPEREFAPDYQGTARWHNREDVHRATLPAAGGLAPARDLARFYAMVANGGELDGTRLVTPETLERAMAVHAEPDPDATLGNPRRYALGFVRAGTATDAFGTLAPERTVGHAGLGSSVGWADPEANLGFAYVTNGIRDGYEHRVRVNELATAVRRIVAG